LAGAESISLRLAVTVMVAALCGQASADPGVSGYWSLQIENDLWGDKDDRYYTGGWQLGYAPSTPPPDYLQAISGWLPFYHDDDNGYHGFNLGQKIFTPEDIFATSVVEDDRPYAGWLFVESYIGHRYFDSSDREKVNGLILTLGIVGPASMGEQSQELVHRYSGSDEPLGWDNQLENELGLNATFVHQRHRIFNLGAPRQYEARLHSALALGNVYTYAALGIMLRWGTHLKDDIGPSTIGPGFPGLPSFNPQRSANWYLYAGLEGRAVARDIFLDGNTIVDSHSVDKKPLVGDLQFGFAFHSRDLRLSLGQMIRSKEFDGQPEHSQYGLINFTLFVE
jgi:hypothetical protein